LLLASLASQCGVLVDTKYEMDADVTKFCSSSTKYNTRHSPRYLVRPTTTSLSVGEVRAASTSQ